MARIPEKEKVGFAMKRTRGLYPLADADAADRAGLDLIDCGRAIVNSGVPLFQLRVKNRPSSFAFEVGERLAKSCEGSDTLLILNDRADVAELISAAGVHVGQDDLPAAQIRKHYPELLCGVSTHSLVQLREQFEAPPNYIALGPIYRTSSKENADPELGLVQLRDAARLTRKQGTPLVAIGGITEARMNEVAALADLVAVISLVYPPTNTSSPYSWMERRCRSLQTEIESLQLETF